MSTTRYIRPASGASTLLTGLDAMGIVNGIIEAASEWVQVHETESTKRAYISSWERATVEEIHARRDVFLTYLERSFDERDRAFHKLFSALDTAMTSDTQQVAAILGAITTLASRSPFADLGNIELVKDRLADPGFEWTA